MLRLVIAANLALFASGLVLAHGAVPSFPLPVTLAAEASDVDGRLPSWANGLGIITASVTGPVFGLWCAYYMLVIRLPAMEKAYQDQVARFVDQAREDMRTFWKERRDDNDKLTTAISALRDAMQTIRCHYYMGPKQQPPGT